MFQGSELQRGPLPVAQRGESPISVIGAGIAGAWQALLFAQAGREVTLHERSAPAMTQSTSYWAGGMLAPWCEAEASEPVISRLGIRSLDLWREHFPQTPFNGSLVVAHSRDRADFERFAKLTSGHRRLDAAAMTATRALARGPFSRGPVLCGGRPCRAATGVAGTARPLHRRRRHHPIQQRRRARRDRRHRDRLPRRCRARHARAICAASRAR